MKAKPIYTFLLALLLAGLYPTISKATYTVSGSVTAPSNPWHPSGDIIIQANGKLTIPAGYTVQMDAGARIQVQEDGRLKAVGTGTNPIIFTAYTSGVSNHWKGIEIWGNPKIPVQPSSDDLITMDVELDYIDGSNTTVSDQKGGAYLKFCTVENCNYGTVVGEMAASNQIKLYSGAGKGGGVLYADSCIYQYIDYMGICFAPFANAVTFKTPTMQTAGNISRVNSCHIYQDNKNDDFIGIGLFRVVMYCGEDGPSPTWFWYSLQGNVIQNRLTPSSVNYFNFGVSGGVGVFPNTYGFYSSESRFQFNQNTIQGFKFGMYFSDIVQGNEIVTRNTFTGNLEDIVCPHAVTLEVYYNTSTKDYTPYGGQASITSYFALLAGDEVFIEGNQINITNTSGAGLDRGILFPGNWNNTFNGKMIVGNQFNYNSFCFQSDNPNYGAQIECNQFLNSQQYDVLVTNGGLGLSQGSLQRGAYNIFRATCSGETHWHQNPGVGNVNYFWQRPSLSTDGKPVCKTDTSVHIKKSGDYSHCDTASPFPGSGTGGTWRPGDRAFTILKLDSITDSIALMPTSVSMMTDNQLSSFYYGRNIKDVYISLLAKNYEDSLQYDSAFFILNQYSCLRSSIHKMGLRFKVDSLDSSGVVTLTSEIANGFSDCNLGYCDATSHDQALVWYPALILMHKHHFSDSIINAEDSLLVSLASTNTYFANLSQGVLQVFHDSLFKHYTPHDSNYVDSVLYPHTVGDAVYDPPTPMAGIGAIKPIGVWNIYPNPTHNVLNLSVPDNAVQRGEPLNYTIYSTTGQEVLNGKLVITNNSGTLDISMLQPGMYIVKIVNFGTIYRASFVRQ